MKRQSSSRPEDDTSRAGAARDGVLDLNERNWLPRYCRGDELAFDELLLAYRNFVNNFLFRYGIESRHRDDLFQDIFLKILQAAPSYRPSEPLRPWLVSIVLNSVRNFRRDSGRRRYAMTRLKSVTAIPGSETTAPQQQGPAPDEQLDQQSTVTWLEHRITTLPELQREVLVLSTLKGLRMKDIAMVMALPENTVKTHLRRARLALAESLARREQTSGSEKPNTRENADD